MASLTNKAGFLIAANFIKYAVGFALPMLMVRMLDQSDFGTYQQLLLVNSMAVGLLTLGLPSSIYYFYNQVDGRQQSALILQTLAMLAIAATFATIGISWGSSLISESMSNPALLPLLPLYALAIGLLLGSEHFVHFMVSQDRYGTAVWFEVIESLARVTALVLPVFLGYGLRGLVVSAVLYSVLRFTVRGIWVLRTGDHPVRLHEARAHWFVGEQLKYSIPLWCTTIVGALAGVLDRAIVAGSFTPTHFAVYSVGALAIPLDVIFQASVADVLRASLPPLVKIGDMQEVTRMLREAVRKLALIMLPSFIFLFGFAHEFITLLFTDQYAESVHVFRIYLGGMPLYMFVLSLIPQVFGKTRINLIIVLITAAIHIALSFLLLKTIGFYGPALSGLICGYLSTGMYLWIAMRLTSASLSQLLPLTAMAKTAACALLALGTSALVGDLVPWKLIDLSIKGTVFALVFCAAGVLLRLFTEQDRSLVRRWVAKLGLVGRE